ncbi:hypothetical protein J5N97_004074 [Dioscorea zingiberensis]|uniref:SMP-30/Gluconolactonase/LRE-like region domain-containing protein n=1 Tax=Dioscorea zingiberensis TaxID=325984 RepID=A0A9D5D7R1_9LILI|nr:hypothetical protein J5N97_004074 [Dioscorea zingiberensis]
MAASLVSFIGILLLVIPALAHTRHVIIPNAPDLHPVSLAWDPNAQHFLVGSRLRPAISSISDAGVVETLISDELHPQGSFIAAVAIDAPRRRLLAALANPPALAAYDLQSRRQHTRIFSSPLPDDPAALAVDHATGDVFVTLGNFIYKIDLEGKASIFSESRVYGSEAPLEGVAHVSRGFLLVAQGGTGAVFKVDDEMGAAKTVLAARGRGLAPGPGGAGIAVRSDGSAVMVAGSKVRAVRSEDGWGEAAVVDEVSVEGVAMGVTVREGRKAYVLVGEKDEDGGISGSKFRIEEVEWGSDGG